MNTENMKKELISRMNDIENSLVVTKDAVFNKMDETLNRLEK